MGRPSAREQVLDAYEDILIESGSAAVTLDAVAARAKVSKGGLLYHFGSKDALLDGLLDRLVRLTVADVEYARTAPEGVVRYYLLSSVTDASMDKPAHRTSVAALRLLGSEPKVTETMVEVSRLWSGLLAEHVEDPLTAELVAVLGDGLYLRATVGGPARQPLLDRLPDVLHRLDVS
ncbi:TetR/AcrR family transcriptional regulator [Prauserella sp. PE36]|uniref:TetR/AcrR family transcriptional regulator n=1 Tax=Prauserella endophytica TaxID=1592324 RepID=A0ABY2S8G8_9PSEU|nr:MULTISPECIES: TetR/AcrR family transcriptional regulator [Prauserella]PXY30322.1 transcriptional regulator [Prauserella coralliicola]RBM21083.1 TetR/AcrR family transcriptional regulator [Prauserella sp. PE36]TKG72132.1 TetR/AcrR family transcriptional regulator [Prauserella endophytica]